MVVMKFAVDGYGGHERIVCTKVSVRARALASVALVLALLFPSVAHHALAQQVGGFSSSGDVIEGTVGSLTSLVKNTPVRFFAGRLIPNRGDGQYHELQADGAPAFGLLEVRHKYPQRGVWTGMIVETPLIYDCDLQLQAWNLLGTSHEGYTAYLTPGGEASKTWGSTQGTGYYLDAAVLFSWAESWRANGWSQINGVRFEEYTRTLSNSKRPGGALPGPSNSQDELRMSASMWIPYLGIEAKKESAGFTGTLRFICSPLIIGDLTHRENWSGGARLDEGSLSFKKGYFAEGLVECVFKSEQPLSLGFFLKMTAMSVYGDGDLQSSMGGAVQSGHYNLAFRKIAYAIGGSLTVKLGPLY